VSAAALISGALYKTPEQRVSKSGNPFTMATIRVPAGAGSQFWRAFAFADDVRAELDRLEDGDRLTLQGPMSAEIYEAESGPRVNLAITAEYILALRQPTNRGRKDASKRAVA
jgi:hypothetical protein